MSCNRGSPSSTATLPSITLAGTDGRRAPGGPRPVRRPTGAARRGGAACRLTDTAVPTATASFSLLNRRRGRADTFPRACATAHRHLRRHGVITSTWSPRPLHSERREPSCPATTPGPPGKHRRRSRPARPQRRSPLRVSASPSARRPSSRPSREARRARTRTYGIFTIALVVVIVAVLVIVKVAGGGWLGFRGRPGVAPRRHPDPGRNAGQAPVGPHLDAHRRADGRRRHIAAVGQRSGPRRERQGRDAVHRCRVLPALRGRAVAPLHRPVQVRHVHASAGPHPLGQRGRRRPRP